MIKSCPFALPKAGLGTKKESARYKAALKSGFF
jgi:hypothetical protein